LNESIEEAVRRVRIVYRSDGLRLVPPYMAEARTYVKSHWRNRTLEDIVQREFYPITSAHMAQLVSRRALSRRWQRGHETASA
jgi:hypothetical protein